MKPPPLLRLAAALPLLVSLGSAGGCGHQQMTTPELYSTYCTRCHGARGEGQPDSLTLYPHLNLLTSTMIRGGDRAAVRRRIADGYGPMPGFKRRLTPEELERLIDFTLQLKERP